MEITSLCDRLKILPGPGGLLDQERTHIRKMQTVLEVLDKYEEEEMKKEANKK